MEAVVLQDLSKIYPGGKKAVNRLCLSLAQGEVFGFLGPNGAGKTTTVKLLNGMLTPSEGSCLVLQSDSFLRYSVTQTSIQNLSTKYRES